MKRILVLIAVIVTVTVNFLANAIPLNGKTTGEISDRFDILFVPAGYVFSIWGLIYLGLFAFAVYQFLPQARRSSDLDQISNLFILSCLANVSWIFLWHYELFPLTLLAMGTLLVSLILIYRRLRIGEIEVPLLQKWLVHIPFSIYLAWISVATISNVSVVLTDAGWNGWGLSPTVWTVVLLIIAAAITVAVAFKRKDVAYFLVIVWAFSGIAVKQANNEIVALTAWVAAIVVLIIAIISLRLNSGVLYQNLDATRR